MSATVTEIIKGRTYRLVKLPPLQGGRLALRVGQLLSGALSDVSAAQALFGMASVNTSDGGAVKEAVSKLMADNSGIIAALAGSVAKIDADALYTCAMECLRGGLFTESGKLPDDDAMNSHFAQYPGDLLLVMAWALKANCAGFFGLRAPA